VNKSGRNSIPFLIIEEEKELPIIRKSKNKNELDGEPSAT
jgi:hypothetical protein